MSRAQDWKEIQSLRHVRIENKRYLYHGFAAESNVNTNNPKNGSCEKRPIMECLLICRGFSNSTCNLAITPVAVSRFLENICQNAACGVEGVGN